MELVDPEALFESGRSHALAAQLLHEKSLEYAAQNGVDDPKLYAFNGPYSLSLHYLIGLGFELMLKAAYVKYGGIPDPNHIRMKLGHDLRKALREVKNLGFEPAGDHFEEIIEIISEPYKCHYFRYSRPRKFPLPNDEAIFSALADFDRQLCEIFGWETYS